MSFLNCIIISFLWHVEYSGVWCLPYAISTNLILSPAVLHVTRSDLFMMSQHKQKQIWPQDWAHILLLFERKRHHPKNKIYILSDVSCLFVMQSEAQLDRVSFKFIPPSISLCPRGWENGLECPSLFLDPLLSGPLIYTLDADSSGSQPALNKKKKRRRGGSGNVRQRKRARQDKAGSGEKLNTVSVVCMKGGFGTNTGRSVRVSCAAPCSMPASSILSLSSHCAQWHWESTHSNTWPLQRSVSPLL